MVTQFAILHTAEPSPDEDSAELGVLVPRVSTAIVEQQFDDSLFFFDAAQDSLDMNAMLELYPIITTANIPTKKNVSLDDPVSMLGHDVDGTVFHDAMSYRNLLLEQSGRHVSFSNRESHQHDHKTAVAKSHTTGSRLSRITSQFFKSNRHIKSLQEPRIVIQERGFPGTLSPDELDACVSDFPTIVGMVVGMGRWTDSHDSFSFFFFLLLSCYFPKNWQNDPTWRKLSIVSELSRKHPTPCVGS